MWSSDSYHNRIHSRVFRFCSDRSWAKKQSSVIYVLYNCFLVLNNNNSHPRIFWILCEIAESVGLLTCLAVSFSSEYLHMEQINVILLQQTNAGISIQCTSHSSGEKNGKLNGSAWKWLEQWPEQLLFIRKTCCSTEKLLRWIDFTRLDEQLLPIRKSRIRVNSNLFQIWKCLENKDYLIPNLKAL